ncbi:MAG: hypothetical protein GX445_08950 [Elusimicrobia bacterium]|nr:hypothetical protein [Elusimicrobiota bacterium]
MSKIFKRYKKTKILLIVLISIFIIHQLAYAILTKLGPDTHYTKTLRIYYNLIYNLTSCKDGKIREINNEYLRFKYISFPYSSYPELRAKIYMPKDKNKKEVSSLFTFKIGDRGDINIYIYKKEWYSLELKKVLEKGKYCWYDYDYNEKCIEVSDKVISDFKKGDINYDNFIYISGLNLDEYDINEFTIKDGFRFISFDAKPTIPNNLHKIVYGILKGESIIEVEIFQKSRYFDDYNIVKGMWYEFFKNIIGPGSTPSHYYMIKPSWISHDKRLACSFKMILDTIEVKDEKSQKSAK